MGLINSILYFSKENTYTDDNSFNSDTSFEYESTTKNNDEINIPINSTTTDWIYYNLQKNHGIEILN